MKGVNVSDGIEYRIELKGEQWSQGEEISGTYEAIPHSGDLKASKVYFALGDKKKIKKGDPKAFTVLWEEECTGAKKDFSFSLEKNSIVTDSALGLFCLFGHKDDLLSCGSLEVNTVPHSHLTQIISVIENFLRFKVKKIKYQAKQSQVDFQMVPPVSREYSSMEKLSLKMVKTDQGCELFYTISLKKLDSADLGMQIAKKKVDLQANWTEREYLICGDTVDQDRVQKLVVSTLQEALPKFFS